MAKTYRKLETWLAARKKAIGASEARILCGLGYANESPLSLWKRKVYGDVDTEAPFQWRIGQVLEHAILKLYHEQTGVSFELPKGGWVMYEHPYAPLAATPDAFVTSAEIWGNIPGTGEPAAVPAEVKNVGQHAAAEWADGKTPLRHQVQCQVQMACCGTEHAVIIALIGGQQLEHRLLSRNEAFVNVLIDKSLEFWNLVESKRPPDPDDSIATARAIAEMFHEPVPGDIVCVPDLAVPVLDRLILLKEQQALLESLRRNVESMFKLAIGNAEYGILPDGRCVSWKQQTRTTYNVPDEIKEQYKSTTSYRVFRIHQHAPKELKLNEHATYPLVEWRGSYDDNGTTDDAELGQGDRVYATGTTEQSQANGGDRATVFDNADKERCGAE